ncbi:MAG: protein-disulfide reductase DsbD domain-containing protein [Chitinophagaceae bacterium]
MMKKTFFTLIAAVIIQTSFGQILNPVKFSFSKIDKGSNQYEVHIKTSVDPKWHIYSISNPEGGAVPTSVSFKNATPIGKSKEIGKLKTTFEKEFNVDQKFYEDQVEFVQLIKLLPGNKKILGAIEYMACNDRQCLPPKKISFEIPR